MKVAVLIPTYNERDNIERLISEVAKAGVDSIYVIDDGSPDGTAELVKRMDVKGLHLIERGRKLGIGSAYLDGIGVALKDGADVIVQMDADFSHPPELIPKLVDSLKDADVAVASRYVKGGSASGLPIHRRLVSWVANALARALLGIRTKDATGGFRAFRREVAEWLLEEGMSSKGYEYQIESIYKAEKKGFKVVEVPYEFGRRAAGRSKLKLGDMLNFLVFVIKLSFGK